uniref:HintN domain-containing protein n=1 Tax=Strongyloides venezuelensis TaxID=75913 RepID=A0A0K0EUI1_STRVS
MFSNYICLLLAIFIVTPKLTLSSFCGESSIPFSFEILPNGQPVLGCARPSCFGWDSDGTPLTNDAQFYRIHKKADGFLRKQAENFRRVISEEDAKYFKPKQATCSKTFEAESCPGEDEWVGGIAPASNYSELPLAIQCCSFEGLKDSEDRGVAVVNVGQIVIGGEVFSGKRQYAFDYIKDILKHTSENGSVYYDVSIRRISCLPLPDELSIKVDKSVLKEFDGKFVEKVQEKMKEQIMEDKSVAFQAPTFVANRGIGVNTEESSHAAELIARELASQDNAGIRSNEVLENVDTVRSQPVPQDFHNTAYVSRQVQTQGAVIQQLPTPVQSQYYPVSGYGGGAGAGGSWCPSFFCFSADTLVQTIDGNLKPISELEIGKDWVLSRNKTDIVYSQVTEWIHRDDNQEAEFIKISLDDGKELKITAYHYIYKTECTSDRNEESLRVDDVERKAVYAKDVNVGDCLYVISTDKNTVSKKEVTSIDTVTEIGIYAPMTGTGDIVVEGILASCENIIHNNVMRSSFYQSFKYFADFIPNIISKKDDSNTVNLPYGLELAIQMMNTVMPKEIFSY